MANKIILVDDEKAVLGLLEELLTLKGYDVESFSSAVDAFNAYQQECEQYGLIVSDQTMPSMLGIELIQKMNALKPISAILCTGYSEPLGTSLYDHAGILGVLRKPFDISELLRLVDEGLSVSGSR